jgi:hypothetical protein
MFFAFVTIAIIAGSSAIYVYFFLPQPLTSAETARRLNSLYSRTANILNYMSDDMQAWANHTITNATFSNRMSDLKSDMLNVRADLTELRKVAFPTYIESIDLLDSGLVACGYALDYAHDFNFNQTLTYSEQAIEYLLRSARVMPTS